MTHWRNLAITLFTAAAVVACGGGDGSSDGGGGGTAGPGAGNNTGEGDRQGKTYTIESGTTEKVTEDAQDAFIQARPRDTIEFGCGFFALEDTLLLTETENVTVKGCGRDRTVLSFAESQGAVGILVTSARGITIQDLTVADSSGNAIELRNVEHGTLRGVRAFWSSGGGASSSDPISASNYQDGRLQVKCTDPATQNPNVPENKGPRADITSPDYTVSSKSGRYGIYPVKSKNILVEDAESIGASDAGIYVGQTTTAIIRDSRAAYNVFGFEIENVRHGEYANNTAECNTGGFLVYDLPNLTRYGQRTLMHDNTVLNNNSYNFAKGGFVAKVPSGSGMITLAYDRITVRDNTFEDNRTAGIIHTSYQIFPEGAGRPSDNKIDFYTEGMSIVDNTFRHNGYDLPNVTTTTIKDQKVAQLLPTVLGLKTAVACLGLRDDCPIDLTTAGRGAHIVWDGLLPEYNADCPYPTNGDGNRVPKEPRFPGKPRFTNAEPQPDCHYNKYKFETDSADEVKRDDDGKAIRKKPEYFASCISGNDFGRGEGDKTVKFSNFHGTKGLEILLDVLSDNPLKNLLDVTTLPDKVEGILQFGADLDLSDHRCQEKYGETLDPVEPVTIPEFEPSGDFDPAPTEEEIARRCNADVATSEVNWGATQVNCPRLEQYNLFGDADDPTSQPHDGGFPYVLNTKLFSDYSVKYRVIFLPPGKKAGYRAPGADKPSATIRFPVGTVIAKTFSFLDENADSMETPIETRLLIKRQRSNGDVHWKGLPYLWQQNDSGEPVARLEPSGKGDISASWDYTNVNSGQPVSGSTDSYSVPNANQCLSCHRNRNRPAGSAPIGPRVRNLNRAYESESSVMTHQAQHQIVGSNQIAWMCNNGKMRDCPDIQLDPNGRIASNLEYMPKYNVRGDGKAEAGTDADIQARTKAWLDANCEHCHNPDGGAAKTGLYMDFFREVNTSYGICKTPAATGSEGSGGRPVDIEPGNAGNSILSYRIGPEADTPAARMPPIARSVVNNRAHDLVKNWINNVVDGNYEGAGCG